MGYMAQDVVATALRGQSCLAFIPSTWTSANGEIPYQWQHPGPVSSAAIAEAAIEALERAGFAILPPLGDLT